MTEKKSEFLPLNNLPDDRVDFQLEFPEWVPTDKIGVNLKRLHRLCDMGGIAEIRLVTSEDNDISKSTPTVVGMDSRGRAFAGKSATKNIVPTFSSQLIIPGMMGQPHGARWAMLTVVLNPDEMAERIRGKEEYENFRSAKGWSDQIDGALRDSITGAGVLNLNNLTATESIGIRKRYLISLSGLGFVEGIGLLASNPEQAMLSGAELYVPILIGAALLNNLMERFRWMKDRRYIQMESPHGVDMAKYRKSLFLGPSYDRIQILKFLSATQRVVKDI